LGRNLQVTDSDSGRSISLDRPRRDQCRQQARERSPHLVDRRRADDRYAAHTVHRGSRRHRPQPLRCGTSRTDVQLRCAGPRVLQQQTGSTIRDAPARERTLC